jgi:hypothetical protein
VASAAAVDALFTAAVVLVAFEPNLSVAVAASIEAAWLLLLPCLLLL